MDWTGILFSPMKLLVGYPERVAAVATVFLIIFLVLGWQRKTWSWWLLWATLVWTAYAIWEWVILSQEANIRVDVLLIYPLLVGVTFWAIYKEIRFYSATR
jgi:CDP-diglyceride synthetase